MGEPDDYDDGFDDDDEPDFDCPFDPNSGHCPLAGTEECDWECPYREDYESPAAGPGRGR